MSLKSKQKAIYLKVKNKIIQAVEQNERYSDIMKDFNLKNKNIALT